jgi:hypothetical protein
MKQNLTRKQFLRTGTKVAAGVAVGATVFGSMDLKHLGASARYPDWPWPYTQIDPEVARIKGHDAYWSGKGCSYGGFHGIIETLREQVGEPFTTFPDEIMYYGAGGGAGWGATCGAINGAAAAISLVSTQAITSKLVNELYGWYTLTMLPTDISNQLAMEHKFGVDNYSAALPQSASHSPLCHASVTMWCEAATIKEATTERKERCARLTGDVAAYAAQLLNDNLAGVFNPLYSTPQTVTDCMACHGSAMIDNVASKMECNSCHGDPHVSGIRQTGDIALNYELQANYPNPFNPGTKINFSIPHGENVFLQVFDSHGRQVSTIINGTYMAPGTYEYDWDAGRDAVMPLSSGTYFVRLAAGKFVQSRKMILLK